MKDSEFQLLSQRLRRVDFEINKGFKNKSKGIRLKLFPEAEVHKDKKENKAIVIFKLKIFDKKELEKYPFFMNLEIEGVFSWSENVDNIDEYLKINAPAVLMSYLRSIVTQLTVFAGYPPLILPLIDFTKDK
ncbi:protein-export chaperone SecB [bacterium]|nr:protein-export chaperone SecB [bacterium]